MIDQFVVAGAACSFRDSHAVFSDYVPNAEWPSICRLLRCATSATMLAMNRVITQRELRNQSAAVLREVEAGRTLWDPIPFDDEGARAYGRLFAAARAAGQSSRSRFAELLIASTAAANNLPLYTRNPDDFQALRAIVKVIAI